METTVAVIPPDALRQIVREEITAVLHGPTDGRTAEAAKADLPDPKEWLTQKEAESYLGLSKTTLQRYRDSGLLPYSKVGANVFYRRADVLAMLEEHRRTA